MRGPVLQPGEQFVLYDCDMSRKLAVVPEHYQLHSPLSLLSLCGDAMNEWDSTQRPTDQRLFASFQCCDADGNPIRLNCYQQWHNGGIQLRISVPFWVVNKSHLPLLLKMVSKDKETTVPHQLQFLRIEKARLLGDTAVNGLEGICNNDMDVLLLNDEEVVLNCFLYF